LSGTRAERPSPPKLPPHDASASMPSLRKPARRNARAHMSDDHGSLSAAALVRSTAIFRDLSDEQLAAVWSQAKMLSLMRGDVLVRQHSPSDSVYIVVSGRFEVHVDGHERAVNEVGVGETIGETGFFSGAPRNATIVAARDSVVLALDRPSFERVAQEVPAIYQTLVRALARRLADLSSKPTSGERVGVARTVAIITGGSAPIPPGFFERLGAIVTGRGKGFVLTQEHVQSRFPGQGLDDPTVLNWLNAIENEYELIAYRTDDTLT